MLLNSPSNFIETLGELPRGVTIKRKPGSEADVIVLFVTQFSKFQLQFGKAAACLPSAGGMLWIAWPKKAAKTDTDLSENLIRDFGLAAGLVDTKVCAVDEIWSGLRFSRRRS